LFRGRYQAILVDAENYLLQHSRYIHLNPVEAKIVTHPIEYEWSSYKFFCNDQYKPKWLYCDEILKCFTLKNPIQKFYDFINEGTDQKIKEFYDNASSFSILGANKFIEEINIKPGTDFFKDHIITQNCIKKNVSLQV